MVFHLTYYGLEAYTVFLAIVGAWRLAQSTRVKGSYVNVKEYAGSEDEYKPYTDLNPARIIQICKWFVNCKGEPQGVADPVVLKKQYNWGLRLLIASIILQYILSLINR